ncbi:DMT family transporter [Gordonia sp. (in: high G+C Gram-positive bacteria)]|uniref:EamA family transporter n=1 Tax=Gordonia sp. (in: high G+C Gram-positive bacteria) TaxID=84139 RepID=UPI0025BE7A64|nr:EamA family transporter [Gordonia sp. (in: high G+C Gram-positive bacteria)]HMS76723.1 EamA family transporter [Gordonia sp. (in: high G+C Gram-positive bacteria)]HQV17456.1 EamA family transporter [Gordonia sp. (in: high G+C Gram-positive bacteria)]
MASVVENKVWSQGRSGLAFALISALSFGLSGALARPLLESGWSSGTIVTIRIGVGGLALVPVALRDMHGRWSLLRKHALTIGLYGLFGVVIAQFCFFSAIQTIPVASAMLIEHTAPVVVLLWLWAAHRQRPSALLCVGVMLCAIGLLCVLEVTGGGGLDVAGVLWATAAMVGAVGYFFISAKPHRDLPPSVLSAAGMIAAAVLLGVLGSVGLMPFDIGDSAADFTGFSIPAWLALLGLAVITVAVAYPTGIVAARILGARLASLIALTEVIAATIWAAVLLSEVPSAIQLAGGVLVIAGVVCAKLGEPESAADAGREVVVGAPDVVDTCGLSDEPPGPDAADCNPPRA